MKRKMTISAVVITKNEEEMIGNCLQSLNWVDEIIVTDSESSDKTATIAKKFTTKIYKHKQINVGRQRQWAVNKATKEWIFSIDADETVSKKLQKEIKEAVKNSRYDAYNIYFQQFFLGKPLPPTMSGGHPRLFRNGCAHVTPFPVHERIIIKGRIGQLKNTISHYSYRSFPQILTKFNHYSDMEAEMLYKQGSRTDLFHIILALTYQFYQRQKIYKDYQAGIYGFILTGLFLIYTFLKWVKVWELQIHSSFARGRLAKLNRFSLLMLFLLGLLVRIYFIFLRSPGGDEIWAFFLAKASLKDIWLGTLAELHPPLYFLFLHFVNLLLAGSLNIFIMRFISLFFGLLTSFSLYLFCVKFINKKAAVLALILSLFLPSMVYISVFARYYSILTFLSVMVLWVFINFLKAGKLKDLFLLVLLISLGTYLHYYFSLYLIIFGVYLCFLKRKLFFRWLLAVSGVFIFCLPELYYLILLPKPSAIGINNSLYKIPSGILVNFLPFETILSVYYQGLPVIYLVSWIGLIFMSLLLIWKSIRNLQQKQKYLFVFTGFIPFILVVIGSYLFRPILGVGSLVIFAPAFLIIFSKGLTEKVKYKKILISVFIISIFINMFGFWQNSAQTIYQQPFNFIKSRIKKGDLVLHSDIYTFILARYYLGEKINFGIIPSTAAKETENALDYRIISLDDILKKQGRVWYIEPGFYNKAGDTKKQFERKLQLIKTEKFPGILFNIELYDKKPLQ